MGSKSNDGRHIGVWGATGVGVGAIVGGGILALAGVAFSASGPGAIVAFALNGIIAILTVYSFAEMAARFPQSGGTYVFAKKVLSVETAFLVGWVVWFASIVAAVLYAIGFGQFAAVVLEQILPGLGVEVPGWLNARPGVVGLGLLAALSYGMLLLRSPGGGGNAINIGKVVVFALLIAGGLWSSAGKPLPHWKASLSPFFEGGAAGLFQAMGFTFIALQGFDLIAAVAGEIKNPVRNLPRAMFGSLGIALLIYLPLLLVVCVAGLPEGTSAMEASRQAPETIIAVAAGNFLGKFGYWLVMVAGVLSMLSALQANLFAASRIAQSMARDRTLPRTLARATGRHGAPGPSVVLTTGIVMVTMLVLPSVAAAGAASSLIFLITFALAHWISILIRLRSQGTPPPFRAPFFPAIPIVGGLACLALAIYQGVAVPSAGGITLGWLAAGGGLFMFLFAHGARVSDAASAALDPEIARLRGRNPLILVPVANPANSESLLGLANALAPQRSGRALILSVVVPPENWVPASDSSPIQRVQEAMGRAMAGAAHAGIQAECLTTLSSSPWSEIKRVAGLYRCESILLGLSKIEEAQEKLPIDGLVNQTASDLVTLRAPEHWNVDQVKRILVPIAGRSSHQRLLARLLGSLQRTAPREVVFMRVLPPETSVAEEYDHRKELGHLANDLAPGHSQILLVRDRDPLAAVVQACADMDLLIMGVQQVGRKKRVFGTFTLNIARKTRLPLLVISARE